MNISQNVSQNGLLGGCAAVLYVLVLYLVDIAYLVHPLYALVPTIIIFPTFMTLSALQDRRDLGGYIKIEQAFKSAFFTAAFALFLLVSFNFVLRAAIDPEMVAVEKEASIDISVRIMERIGAEEAEIEKMVEQIEETDTTPRLGNTLSGYVLALALGSIPALIIAAFVRKLPPVGSGQKQPQDEVLDEDF